MLSQEEKNRINSLSYETLFRLVRFAPVGDARFQGELGEYTFGRFNKMREIVGPAEHTATSKRIEWERP